MANPNLIVLSIPTSGNGATAAATFLFNTSGYNPPRQARAVGWDDVHNQNGHFRYRYDNGPGALSWSPFQLVFNDDFGFAGSATQQYANFLFLNQYTGSLGLSAPEGSYQVAWGSSDIEHRFNVFPHSAGDKYERRVVVNLVEG